MGTSPTSAPNQDRQAERDKDHGAVDTDFLGPGKTLEPNGRQSLQDQRAEQHAQGTRRPRHQHVLHD